jgi:large subunit ribosomal protein L28
MKTFFYKVFPTVPPDRRVRMSAHCQLTGRKPGFGNSISHSHRRTPRRFDPNVQSKRYWLPAERRYVRLTLSAKGIKTVDRIGIDKAVRLIRARGHHV